MKYQYILNDTILFETNDIVEYIQYLNTDRQVKDSVLYNLLEKSNGYICEMATA